MFTIFGRTAQFGFVNYDDGDNVYDNATVQKGLSLQNIGWAFTHAQVANWIPLTTLSHMAVCQFFGLNAGAHHLANVLLHAAAVVLLFLVLRQMTGALWRSFFVAAIFAIHPLRAESVAWISERKDVLSAVFFMLAIGAYVRNVQRPSRVAQFAVILFFACGLMSKSMVATLPFVLLFLDYWPLKRISDFRFPISGFKRLLLEKIPLFVLAAMACAAVAFVPGLAVVPPSEMTADAAQPPFFERIENAPVAYMIYLRQLIFPSGLAIPYPNPDNGLPLWEVALAFVLLAAISALVFSRRGKNPYLLVGWLWYLGMLFPVIGIVSISNYAAHADRYTYLPVIGLAIAATWAVADWSARWKFRRLILGGLMIVVIGALMICARTQVSYWRDSETLWTRALSVTSGNIVACDEMGNALFKAGKPEEAIAQYRRALEINARYEGARNDLADILSAQGRTDEAMSQYLKVLEINPDFVEARYNVAVDLASRGNLDEAIAQYKKVLEINPGYTKARNNLGTALFQEGKLDEAAAQFQKAVEASPDYADARNNLGLALARAGKTDDAIVQYRKALQLKPGYDDANYNLGLALLSKDETDGAIAQFRKTLEINPRYFKAFNDLGTALLQKGDLSAAIAAYQQALQINPQFAGAYASLGVAFFQNKQNKEAIYAWRQSLALDPRQPSVLNNLAWLLATSPDAADRDGAEAITFATQADQLTGGKNPMILRTLAAAQAETGKYAGASQTARNALQLAEAARNTPLADILRQDISLYDAGAPIRDVRP